MKIFFASIILSLLCIKSNAQLNLVPNSSFEQNDDSINCPVGPIDVAIPWVNPTGGSPDYFNNCTILQPGFSVPQNKFGFQYAHSGNAYSGLATFCTIPENGREYIQVKLNDSLIISKIYFVNFYVSLADSGTYATDRIGLYFSDTAIFKSIFDYSPFSNFAPQIENQQGNIITDKENWTSISGIYNAHGGEQYITIGNFYDDVNTDTLFVGGSQDTHQRYSYLYIDNVSITLINEDSLNSFSIANAFTPNGDGKNDIFIAHGKNIKTVDGIIINRWGQELFKWSDVNGGWDGKHDGQDVSAGAYFYIITVTYNNEATETKKGCVEVVR